MFGLYRFTLAIFVAATHVGKLPASAGGYAVFAFYMLSGYLMTAVLNQVYLKKDRGVLVFWINRALRIFPALFAVQMLSVLMLWVMPAVRQPAYQVMQIPDTLIGWMVNVLLVSYVGFDGAVNRMIATAQIVPVAWSIYVELIFYAIMPIIVRRKCYVAIWLMVSMFYTICAMKYEFSYGLRYNSPLAASLPFSIGSCVYCFIRERIPVIPVGLILALALVYVLHAVQRHLYEEPMAAGLYVSTVLSLMLVATLSNLESNKIAKIDRCVGNLSYPIFLSHYLVGFCVVALFPSIKPQSNLHLLISMPIIIVVAYGLWRLIELPISQWREQIRSGTAALVHASRHCKE